MVSIQETSEYEDSISKYIASFDDVLDACGNDKFLAQKHFFQECPRRVTSFCPFVFFASNIQKLTKTKGSVIWHRHTITLLPKFVKIVDDTTYLVYNRGTVKPNILTDLFINFRMKGKKLIRDSFPYKSYHSQYYTVINLYYEVYPDKKTDSLATNVSRFYVEYGYWYNLELSHVNGLQYIASNPDFIKNVSKEESLNIDAALQHYFQNKCSEQILSFDPIVYLVSNWSTLKQFVKKRCINVDSIYKQYITIGCKEKYAVSTFDHWTFLANNPKYIHEILTNKEGKIDWNFMKLTQRAAAEIFIKYEGRTEQLFNAEEFVKMYVSDTTGINKEKKLSLDNSAFYFVKGYTTSDIIRWRTGYTYQSLQFLRNRMFDLIKQMPLHIARYICMSKM